MDSARTALLVAVQESCCSGCWVYMLYRIYRLVSRTSSGRDPSRPLSIIPPSRPHDVDLVNRNPDIPLRSGATLSTSKLLYGHPTPKIIRSSCPNDNRQPLTLTAPLQQKQQRTGQAVKMLSSYVGSRSLIG